jgi:hypothetical protein
LAVAVLVLAYLSQYEFQFGIGALGAVFVVSALVAALGFGDRKGISARVIRLTWILVAVAGLALCSAALADFQPGCNWCRHDGWGGGESPSPIFLVWLVGLVTIGVVQNARAIRAGRKPASR